MSVLGNYLANRLLFEEHPVLEEEACLNHKQSRFLCRACVEVCSNGVFDKSPPDWSRCSGCNFCVSVCPARCLRPSARLFNRFLEVWSQPGETVLIGCEHTEAAAGWTIPCLASLPWEGVALLALDKAVSLDCHSCIRCPDSRTALWDDWQQHLRDHCGPLMGTSIDALEEDRPQEPAFSRREMFSAFAAKSQRMLAELLPENLPPDGLLYRRLLIRRLRQKAEGTAVPLWAVSSFCSACKACGICVKLCPHRARHRRDGDSQGLQKTWYMAVIPWRCTGCGLCESVCPHKGTASGFVFVSNPETPQIHMVAGPACQQCGEPLMDGESRVCTRCHPSHEGDWSLE